MEETRRRRPRPREVLFTAGIRAASARAVRTKCRTCQLEYRLMEELLSAITAWYSRRKSPNSLRRYHSCPICGATWWGDNGMFGREHHNRDCWIPLVDLAKLDYMRSIGT